MSARIGHRNRTSKLVRRRIPLLLAGAAMALAACGGSSSGGTGTTATNPAGSGSVSSTASSGSDSKSSGSSMTGETTATAGGTSSDSGGATADSEPTGTLRYAYYTDTTTFDPAKAAGVMSDYILPEYDTLLTIDSNGKVLPNLATEWKQDGLTYTLTLRDDVVFHDGSAFDATAAKATLDRNKAIAESPFANIYASIASVDVVDATHLTITLAAAAPGFLYAMATNAGAMISPKAVADGTDLTRAPAGSGPFIWDSKASREGSLHVYHANPNYWNPSAVKVANYEIHVVPDDNARLNGVDTGQYDIAGTVPANLVQSAKDSGLTVNSVNNLMVGFVVIDDEGTTVPALADDRVRQAIGYLIDRNAFNAAVLGGQGDPVPGGYFNQQSQWYDPTLNDVYGQSGDVDKAKALLADAGYADGFTITAPSLPVVQRALEAIAQMLARGGITLNIVQVQPGTLSSSMRAGEYPVGFASSTSTDPADWFQYQISPDGPYNPFKSQRFVATAATEKKAAAATDPKEQKSLYDQVQRDVLEAGKMFPASFSPTSIAVADTVTGSVMLRRDGAISVLNVAVKG